MAADRASTTDDELTALIAEVAAETEFSGVVRVDRGGRVIEFAAAAANRAADLPLSTSSMLALASGTKSLTAVLIGTLIDEGHLRFDSPVAPLVGPDLPLIDPAVTVEHLLTHRSAIADYLDDDEGGLPAGYLPADLGRTIDYVPLLAGLAPTSPPGEHFSYCSAGFVILALIADR